MEEVVGQYYLLFVNTTSLYLGHKENATLSMHTNV